MLIADLCDTEVLLAKVLQNTKALFSVKRTLKEGQRNCQA